MISRGWLVALPELISLLCTGLGRAFILGNPFKRGGTLAGSRPLTLELSCYLSLQIL